MTDISSERKVSGKSETETETETETNESGSNAKLTFEPKELIEHFTMMIYGARRVGKTHMASFIVSQIHKRFEKVYLFSQTTEFQPDAWSFIPDDYKFASLDTDILGGIFAKTQEDIKKARLELKRGKRPLTGDKLRDAVSKKVPHYLFILDDIINDTTIRNNPYLAKLFVSGRHLRVSLMFLSQTPARGNTIGPIMRSNVDYCLCSEFDTEDDLITIAGLFFAKEGKKRGIERIHELTDKKHMFAISELHMRGKKSLQDHTYNFTAPGVLPKFELKCAKELRTCLHTTTSSIKNGDYKLGFNEVPNQAKFKDRKPSNVIFL